MNHVVFSVCCDNWGETPHRNPRIYFLVYLRARSVGNSYCVGFRGRVLGMIFIRTRAESRSFADFQGRHLFRTIRPSAIGSTEEGVSVLV